MGNGTTAGWMARAVPLTSSQSRRALAAIRRRAARPTADSPTATAYATELLLGRTGRLNARLPQDKDLRRLARSVEKTTGVDDAWPHVVSAYRTLVDVESHGVGRIAGGTTTILAKLTAAPLLHPPNDQVLEIGTLYGLFACAMHRQLLRRGIDAEMTIVDPLTGLQEQPGHAASVDASRSPVTRQVVEGNLRLAGVPAERRRVLPGYSTDDHIRQIVADRRYGMVVVDGDHSAEGVLKDLAWVEALTIEGGIVVLDDFGSARWPGVELAVTQHLAGGSRFSMLGRIGNSAYLRAST